VSCDDQGFLVVSKIWAIAVNTRRSRGSNLGSFEGLKFGASLPQLPIFLRKSAKFLAGVYRNCPILTDFDIIRKYKYYNSLKVAIFGQLR